MEKVDNGSIKDDGSIKVDIDKLNILDTDTGVYNADFFYLRLNEEIKRATRYDLFFSFMLIELNNKRKIFENPGENFIDAILDEMGYTIKDSIRGDIDLAGYIEEGIFAVILPETDIQGANILAKRIKNRLDKGLNRFGAEEESEDEEEVSVSVAIIEVPEDAKTAKLALSRTQRALIKGKRESSDNIGLSKPLEKYTSKKKTIIKEKPSEAVEEKKAADFFLPFIELISQPDMKETEKPGEVDVKILKEIEKKGFLYSIVFEGEGYVRKTINTFGTVKLLNQKKFIFIEDPLLRTAIPCVTPQSDPDIRNKILQENIYCAGTIIYSYEELREFNSYTGITQYNTDSSLSSDDKRILKILNSLKGGDSTGGKWIVDPNSPFDPLYMMVRRRFLFKTDSAPGIYYKDLRKDKESEALYPVYPNCRLSPYEALRLQKKNISLEIITEGGFNHIINNLAELELFHQLETE